MNAPLVPTDDDITTCHGCGATATEPDADGYTYDEGRDETHCENCAAAGPTPRYYSRAYYG